MRKVDHFAPWDYEFLKALAEGPGPEFACAIETMDAPECIPAGCVRAVGGLAIPAMTGRE